MKSLKQILDKWFGAICRSSVLLEIFIIKICEAFSLIVLSTLKQDCEIKTKEILNFLQLKSNSLTIGLILLLASTSAII